MMRLFVIFAISLIVGCSIGETNTNNPAQSKAGSGSSVMTTNFPYEMSADQKKEFIDKVKNFKAGESYEKVLKTLGTPFDKANIRGKKADDPVRGVMITYYMKKSHPDLVNEKKDEYVLIVFDNDKKLIRIRTNVPTLSFPLNGK